MLLNKDQVIVSLCSLVTDVANSDVLGPIQHDCFCGMSAVSDRPYVDSDIIDFIKKAVRNETESLTYTCGDCKDLAKCTKYNLNRKDDICIIRSNSLR